MVLALSCSSCSNSSKNAATGSPQPGSAAVNPNIHKIQHVVVIMQENRSFDSYFGVYPGATGIPMNHGVPTVCVPDPMVTMPVPM